MFMVVPSFEFVVVIALEMEKACEPKILTSAQQIEIMILMMIRIKTDMLSRTVLEEPPRL